MLAFNPTYPDIYKSILKDCGWEQFHGDTMKEIPPNAPDPIGK